VAQSESAGGKRMKKVVMYSTRMCPYCIAAKRLLESIAVSFEDIPVDNNSSLRKHMMEKSGRHTVPQIWVGDTHVGGYRELQQLVAADKLELMLDRQDSPGVQ
jgi:glutaredoxin 3